MRGRVSLKVTDDDTCTGISQQCPPPTIKIEKIDGNLRVFGILIGNNCHISLPAFGMLFVFIGVILTIVGFKTPDNKFTKGREAREDNATNIKILGPVCIVVGLAMVACAFLLKYFSTKAIDKHTKIGFYCPVHGDFYPLSPGINLRKYSFSELTNENKWWLPTGCLKKHENSNTMIADIPTCPHSISPSNRSSFDGQHVLISNPNPSTVIITAASVDKSESPEHTQSYGSIGSLLIPNDVVSFPSYRSKSNPPTSPPTPTASASLALKRSSCPILPEIGTVSHVHNIEKLTKFTSSVIPIKSNLHFVKPADTVEHLSPMSNSSINSDDENKKRKSVSIQLPTE